MWPLGKFFFWWFLWFWFGGVLDGFMVFLKGFWDGFTMFYSSKIDFSEKKCEAKKKAVPMVKKYISPRSRSNQLLTT